MTTRPAALPTFLIVGAQKSGTRWLAHQLNDHPEIFVAPGEPEFFNHRFAEGPEVYATHFVDGAHLSHRGESTPGYMFHRENPDRIAGRVLDTLGPDVSIFAILRDPVERTRSAYIHHLQRDRIDPAVDPLAYLAELDVDGDPWGLITGGWYAAGLTPYRERFGPRLRVLFHDRLRSDAVGLYREALDHLGVEDGNYVPAELTAPRNSNRPRLLARHPDHPILTLDAAALRSAVGHHFDDDSAALTALIDHPMPWTVGAETETS
ncbi:MAG: hypothetical protein AAF548_00785 [Actinomycetota bacterium]